jgi:hypothetical protein
MKPTIYTSCPRCSAAHGEPCRTPSGKECELHAARVPTMPKVGDLVLVEFGSGGTQLARVVAAPEHIGEVLRVEKWRDNSARWTNAVRLPWSRLRGVPAANDKRIERASAPKAPARASRARPAREARPARRARHEARGRCEGCGGDANERCRSARRLLS